MPAHFLKTTTQTRHRTRIAPAWLKAMFGTSEATTATQGAYFRPQWLATISKMETVAFQYAT